MNTIIFGSGPDWSKMSTSAGYPVVYYPDHPNAWSTGYMLAHRVVAEQSVKRVLSSKDIVHHKNHDKGDYSIDNLEITVSSTHAKMHSLPRKNVLLECTNCGKTFSRNHNQTHLAKGGKATFCSRSCSGKFNRKVQLGSSAKTEKNVIKIFTI